MKRVVLGRIAHNFTGAMDLANNLVRTSTQVNQMIGVPRIALDRNTDAMLRQHL